MRQRSCFDRRSCSWNFDVRLQRLRLCAMVSTDDLVARTGCAGRCPPMPSCDGGGACAGQPGVAIRRWMRELTQASGSTRLPAWASPHVLRDRILAARDTRTACERGVNVVYAGGAPRSFDGADLLAEPQRYNLRLQLPGVSVFEATACKPSLNASLYPGFSPALFMTRHLGRVASSSVRGRTQHKTG